MRKREVGPVPPSRPAAAATAAIAASQAARTAAVRIGAREGRHRPGDGQPPGGAKVGAGVCSRLRGDGRLVLVLLVVLLLLLLLLLLLFQGLVAVIVS